ncbi:hypothetical protein [Bifidobacterium panos]|uniref:Uncharacterized protein n=1 Tax=Bifidobacterium panos TaxID=2675321 RepID=A0ABX1T1N6_9BIFI|nr:hypothetical protein [Bifidobacterium sp. DSM 109963]NMN02759.1 hypothetical protein [Bifidobacterium sp. DSM 109963]
MTKRRKKLRLIPSHLPLLKQQLITFKRHVIRTIETQKPEATEEAWFQEALREAWDNEESLSSAALWWVSRDMTMLAVDTAKNGDFPYLEVPTATGFVVFEDGLPVDVDWIALAAIPRTVALAWAVQRPSADGEIPILLTSYTDDPDLLKRYGADKAGLPLMETPFDVDVFNASLETRVYRDILHAVWALSTQPRICETRPAQPSRTDPLPARFDGDIRKVKMLVLRENLHRPGGKTPDGERKYAEYSHRFIVRGFFREQPYGTNHSLRRRQWIPPFVKGPADKPLVCKETVRIWKR